MYKINNKISGIALCTIIAIPAWIIGNLFPIIGAPVLGIAFGILVASLFKPSAFFKDGINYSSKNILQYSIILLGFGMNLSSILAAGQKTLFLMMFTLTSSFLAAYIFGKILKIEKNENILIGVGTAICGGSAIAATAPVINANDDEVARSISTIFFFNIIAAFLFPFLGHLMNMSDYNFGLFAGTAINDTSSVVAAGYTYSKSAGDFAVIVKLTRTLMIIPITFFLALYTSYASKKAKEKSNENADIKESETVSPNYSMKKIFPWFIVGFLFCALINTFLTSYSELFNILVSVGKFMIVVAMSAIGLKTDLPKLLFHGKKSILLGLCCFLVLSLTSLIAQYLIK